MEDCALVAICFTHHSLQKHTVLQAKQRQYHVVQKHSALHILTFLKMCTTRTHLLQTKIQSNVTEFHSMSPSTALRHIEPSMFDKAFDSLGMSSIWLAVTLRDYRCCVPRAI